jgi:hypothetical protein
LVTQIKSLQSDVDVVGIDPDPKALARARRKATAAAISIQLDQGFSMNFRTRRHPLTEYSPPLCLFRKRPVTRLGALAFWLAITCIIIFPITMIGLFEGGYNHLIKDALYFAGASMMLMHSLFPPPTYEMPDDVFFEFTGVLQLFVVLPVIYYTYRLVYIKILAYKNRVAGAQTHEK